MSIFNIIYSIQLFSSKSKLLVWVSIKLRNQANRIIALSLAKTHIPSCNGEELILKTYAPGCEIFFDVGANKGDWSKMVSKYSSNRPSIFLFEPGVEAYKYLLQEFSDSNNFHLFNLGLSDSNGELDFFEEGGAGEQSSFVLTSYNSNYEIRKTKVNTLDNFCKKNGINQIDFLKIDCEGFDYKVLLGAKELLANGRIKYLQFEYGIGWLNSGSTLKAAILYLGVFGFEVFSITSLGLKKFDVTFYGEFFEYSNFFATKLRNDQPFLS